jgi:hypothetical protein
MEAVKLKSNVNVEEINDNIENSNLISINGNLYFINIEITSKFDLFNQFLGEYLAKKLFNIPTGESKLFKVSTEIANQTIFPTFEDEFGNKYMLLTKINEEDKKNIYKPFENIYNEFITPTQKLERIKEFLKKDEQFEKVKEYFLKISALDFFMGQYSRYFIPHVNFSRYHITPVYSFGNSYNFSQEYIPINSCTTVFGDINASELKSLNEFSDNMNLYIDVISSLDFPYVIEEFIETIPFEIDNISEYVKFAKEKQNILCRIK